MISLKITPDGDTLKLLNEEENKFYTNLSWCPRTFIPCGLCRPLKLNTFGVCWQCPEELTKINAPILIFSEEGENPVPIDTDADKTRNAQTLKRKIELNLKALDLDFLSEHIEDNIPIEIKWCEYWKKSILSRKIKHPTNENIFQIEIEPALPEFFLKFYTQIKETNIYASNNGIVLSKIVFRNRFRDHSIIKPQPLKIQIHAETRNSEINNAIKFAIPEGTTNPSYNIIDKGKCLLIPEQISVNRRAVLPVVIIYDPNEYVILQDETIKIFLEQSSDDDKHPRHIETCDDKNNSTGPFNPIVIHLKADSTSSALVISLEKNESDVSDNYIKKIDNSESAPHAESLNGRKEPEKSQLTLKQPLEWYHGISKRVQKLFSLNVFNASNDGHSHIKINSFNISVTLKDDKRIDIKDNNSLDEVFLTNKKDKNLHELTLRRWNDEYAPKTLLARSNDAVKLDIFFNPTQVIELISGNDTKVGIRFLTKIDCLLPGNTKTIKIKLPFECEIEKGRGKYWLGIDIGTSANAACFSDGLRPFELINLSPAIEKETPLEAVGNCLYPSFFALDQDETDQDDIDITPCPSQDMLSKNIEKIVPYVKSLFGYSRLKFKNKEIKVKTLLENVIDEFLSDQGLELSKPLKEHMRSIPHFNKILLSHPNHIPLEYKNLLEDIIRRSMGGKDFLDIHFLSESDAVAFNYIAERGQYADDTLPINGKDENVIIYDLGAGTLDITFVTIKWSAHSHAKKVEVLGHYYLPKAGNYMDYAIAQGIAEIVEKKGRDIGFLSPKKLFSDPDQGGTYIGQLHRWKYFIKESLKPRLGENEDPIELNENIEEILGLFCDDFQKLGIKQIDICKTNSLYNFIEEITTDSIHHLCRLTLGPDKIIADMAIDKVILSGRASKFSLIKKKIKQVVGIADNDIIYIDKGQQDNGYNRQKAAVVNGLIQYAKLCLNTGNQLKFFSKYINACIGFLFEVTGEWHYGAVLVPWNEKNYDKDNEQKQITNTFKLPVDNFATLYWVMTFESDFERQLEDNGRKMDSLWHKVAILSGPNAPGDFPESFDRPLSGRLSLSQNYEISVELNQNETPTLYALGANRRRVISSDFIFDKSNNWPLSSNFTIPEDQ